MQERRTVVIHQPDFLPYPGFFHRLLHCDDFVVLDHVQLLRRGWHHRDQVKAPHGVVWFTVPIVNIHHVQSIRDARIDHGHDWIRKQLNRIASYYREAPCFGTVFPVLERILQRGHDRLLDLNMELLAWFLDYFGIRVKMHLSSGWDVQERRNEMNIELVRKVGGKVYLSGSGARAYLDESLFRQAGIEVAWQQYRCRPYPQLHGAFVPNLSCLDFAMNCGSRLRDYVEDDGVAGDPL